MYDHITNNITSPIESFRKNRIKICKQLGHWKYLTPEEQTRFQKSENQYEITNFMVTSRKRAFDAELRGL